MKPILAILAAAAIAWYVFKRLPHDALPNVDDTDWEGWVGV